MTNNAEMLSELAKDIDPSARHECVLSQVLQASVCAYVRRVSAAYPHAVGKVAASSEASTWRVVAYRLETYL